MLERKWKQEGKLADALQSCSSDDAFMSDIRVHTQNVRLAAFPLNGCDRCIKLWCLVHGSSMDKGAVDEYMKQLVDARNVSLWRYFYDMLSVRDKG
jgi:hypothetical protein